MNVGKPVWGVVPDIRPWRGDLRRNRSAYFLSPSMSGDNLSYCNWVASILRKRGIACFVDLVTF